MHSSEMQCHVAFVRTDILEECITLIFGVERICVLQLLATANIVPSSLILSATVMEVIVPLKYGL
jgi:hypothetical protein